MGWSEQSAAGDDRANQALLESLAGHLEPDDDPQFWAALLGAVLQEIDARWALEVTTVRQVQVALSKFQNWARPHQTRWLADGSFAAPQYSSSPPGRGALWTVWLSRSRRDSAWHWQGETERGPRRRGEFTLRLSAPGRTLQHPQAAIAGRWEPRFPWHEHAGTEAGWAWYGLRRDNESVWQLTAHRESRPEG